MFIDDDSSPGVGPYAGCVQVEAVGHRSASGGKQQCVSFPKIGDIAESMLESLKRKGIEIRLNAYALSVYDTADGITLTYTDNSDNT